MTRINRFMRIAAALAVVSMIAVPGFAARGRADFTRLVTLGDSFGAGVSSIGLNISHQRYSWPAVLARQVGMKTDCTTDGPRCFQIPYISEPGILPELQLLNLAPSLALKPGLGTPLNLSLARPYNNLSIDGAEVADLLNGPSGDGNEAINAALVVRTLGTPVSQALALNPTFIAVWIGGNDAFNGVTAGKAAMTSVADFTRDYNLLLDRLTAGAPNAGMVVGNLPTDIRLVPYTNTVPPILVDQSRKPVLNPQTGGTIPLIAILPNGQPGLLPAGSLVTLPAASLIATGYGIPAALAPFLPPLPNIGLPLPDAVTLTPDEVTEVNDRLVAFNGVIAQAAASRDIPVADINALFLRLSAGQHVGPFTYNLNYISGGVISYDGYHLTDIGYTLFANEYIRTINRAYRTRIAVSPVSQFLQNDPPVIVNTPLALPLFTDEALDALMGRWKPAPSDQ